MNRFMNIFLTLFVILSLNSGIIYAENNKCPTHNLSESSTLKETSLNSMCNKFTSNDKTGEKELRIYSHYCRYEIKSFLLFLQKTEKNNIKSIRISSFFLRKNTNLKIPIYIYNSSLLF